MKRKIKKTKTRKKKTRKKKKKRRKERKRVLVLLFGNEGAGLGIREDEGMVRGSAKANAMAWDLLTQLVTCKHYCDL